MDIMEYMYIRGYRWIGKNYDGSLTAFENKPIMAEGKWKSIKQFMCCDKRRKIGYADEFF